MSEINRLTAPIRLTNQEWPIGCQPTVSILCTVYNHRRFIAESIDGFLEQETTFPVEIIIRDDASTDGTTSIVSSYAESYPRLIKPIILKNNMWCKGVKPMPDAFRLSRGKYIATCEGDDFWTNPSKLQQQVEAMESSNSMVLCGGRAMVIRDGCKTPYAIEPSQPSGILADLGPADMLVSKWYFKTLTRLTSREVWQEYIDIVREDPAGCDWLFVLFCISRSRMLSSSFFCLDEVVGTYREHAGGIWSGLDQKLKNESDIRVLSFALRHFDFGAHRYFLEDTLINLCRENGLATTGDEIADRRLAQRNAPVAAAKKPSRLRCAFNCLRGWR